METEVDVEMRGRLKGRPTHSLGTMTGVRAHERRGRPVRAYRRLKNRPGSYVTGKSMRMPDTMAYVETLSGGDVIYLTPLAAEMDENGMVPIEDTFAHETVHQVVGRDEGLRASAGVDYLRHGEPRIYPYAVREDLSRSGRVGHLTERQLAYLGAAGRKRLREREP